MTPEQQTPASVVERLRDALEPIARRVVPDHYDDKTLIGWISAGEIRAAQAALTQGESRQTGWQDIATAPKDGRRFLATGGGLDDAVESCSWSESVACWNLESYTADDRDDEPEGYNRPTHWMPLPAAPTPADGGGE